MAKPRKLPMVKRETVEQRSTSFSKRRYGLFNKAAELALLCDAQLAVVVSSPTKSKYYSFAYPPVDAVLEAFLQNQQLLGGDNINMQSAFSVFNEIKKQESLLKETQNGKSTLEECFELFEKSQSVEELHELLRQLKKLTQKGINKMSNGCSHQGFVRVDDYVNLNLDAIQVKCRDEIDNNRM